MGCRVGCQAKSVRRNRALRLADIFAKRREGVVERRQPQGAWIDQVAHLRERRISVDQHAQRHPLEPLAQRIDPRNVQTNLGRTA